MPVVDLATANEFALALGRELAPDERDRLADELARRHDHALELASAPTEEAVAALLGLVFGIRSRARSLLAEVGHEELAALVRAIDATTDHAELVALAASAPIEPTLASELIAELAHLLHPREVPLLRRWVLDQEEETGALCLLMTDPILAWSTADPVPLAAAVRAELEEASLVRAHPDPWHLDVFLAGVYGVYCATVIRLRMTKEFGGLLPGLGELMGRMLGVRGGVHAHRR
jgi:hypothetical protein